ncbi:hypothetical protein V5O48_001162 [Marasmius crinis-equi]|uniref:F-box domain-containing protein n=1 Tax=Marasmius crinis-equi TaxID=585013 RepID=A0ABR3FZB4_9AGAR
MSGEDLLAYDPFTLTFLWLNEQRIIFAPNVQSNDTLFDVLSKLGFETFGDNEERVGGFRAFLPNIPIPVVPDDLITRSAIEAMGISETSGREWRRHEKAGDLLSLPLDMLRIHFVLEGAVSNGSLPSSEDSIGRCSVSDQENGTTSEADVAESDYSELTHDSIEDIDDSPASPIQYHHLPPEILLDIFRRSLPPSAFTIHQRSIASLDFHRRTAAQKKSLLLVCKDWHHTALEILYEDVYLRDFLQLKNFIEAVETSSQVNRSLVKSLVIEALTPPLQTADRTVHCLLMQTLQRVCHLCTNLSSLSFFPESDQDGNPLLAFFEGKLSDGDPESSLLPSSVFPNVFHLRELRIGAEALQFLPEQLSSCSQTLELLDVSVASTTDASVVDVMEWPHVKWFRCNFYQNKTNSEDVRSAAFKGIRTFAKSLRMPKLERLSISGEFLVGRTNPRSFSVTDSFPLIEAHKERLTYLSMVGFSATGEELAKLFDMASRLRHLVADSALVVYDLPSHRTLQYLDIWSCCTLTNDTRRQEELERINLHAGLADIDRSKFPLLKSVRVFDNALLWTRAHTDLPTVISPEETRNGGEIRYPGLVNVGITSDGKVIYRNDLSYVQHEWDWEKFSSFYRQEHRLKFRDSYRTYPIPWFYIGWPGYRDGEEPLVEDHCGDESESYDSDESMSADSPDDYSDNSDDWASSHSADDQV